MIALDTNVISERARPAPATSVMAWLGRQDAMRMYLPSPVVAEIAFGARRFLLRTGSARYVAGLTDMVDVHFRDRILPFGQAESLVYGDIRAARENGGRPISVTDAMIAAICIVNGATLATRNAADFAGLDLKVVNPFEPA